MMKALRVKIIRDFFVCTEDINFGLVHEYYATLSCNNNTMAGVEEIVYESTDDLSINEHMDLGEEYFYN